MTNDRRLSKGCTFLLKIEAVLMEDVETQLQFVVLFQVWPPKMRMLVHIDGQLLPHR